MKMKFEIIMRIFFTNRNYVKISGQEIGIDKINIHPKYNDPKFSNDIAMMRLLSDVDGE